MAPAGLRKRKRKRLNVWLTGDPITEPPLPDGWDRKTVWDKLIKPGLVGQKTIEEEIREQTNSRLEGLIESFLYSLRNAVWQSTYEKQKSWGQMTDQDFQKIFAKAFTESGMKLFMDNPKITRYINEISLYAFDRFRADLQKTHSLRRSQIRSYVKELKDL